MITDKDYINNLVHTISADIPDDLEVEHGDARFEVWATGCRCGQDVFDTEVLLWSFADPDEADKYVNSLTLADIVHMTADDSSLGFYDDANIDTIKVEIETIIDTPDFSMSAGSMKTVYFPVEVVQEEPPIEFHVIEVTDEDYSVLEDGFIKVVGNKLADFVEGDCIILEFVNNNGARTICKVMRKVIFDEELWVYCDFVL